MRHTTDATSSCLLEAGIFTSHVVWLLRTRKIRSEAAAQGRIFDDVLAEHEKNGVHFQFAERKSRKAEKRSAKERHVEDGALGAAPAGMQAGPKTTDETTLPNADRHEAIIQ